MAGLVVCLLAAIAAAIVYGQIPPKLAGIRSPEAERQLITRMLTLETMHYFHAQIRPGMDIPEPPQQQRTRSTAYVGMGLVAALGTIGFILAAVGIAGLVGRRYPARGRE